jgi:hypothetical protein
MVMSNFAKGSPCSDHGHEHEHSSIDSCNDDPDPTLLNVADDLSRTTPLPAETKLNDDTGESVPAFVLSASDITQVSGIGHVIYQSDLFTQFTNVIVISGPPRTPRHQGSIEAGARRFRDRIQHHAHSDNLLRDILQDDYSPGDGESESDDDNPPPLEYRTPYRFESDDDSDPEENIEEIEELLSLTFHVEEPDDHPEFDH